MKRLFVCLFTIIIISINFAEIDQELLKKAKNGDAEAQYQVGQYYLDNKNKKKAKLWYQKAAKNGFQKAKFILDIFFSTFEKIPKKLINKAKSGDLDSQVKLADEYAIRKQFEKAFYWYKKSKLLIIYLNLAHLVHTTNANIEDNENYEERYNTFRWLKTKAKNGDSEAQYYLACIFLEYEKPHIYEVISVYYLKESAKQNYTKAQIKLAIIYSNNTIIPKNLEKSFYWYKKAADNGNRWAQYIVGNLYYLGKGTVKNETLARNYYVKNLNQIEEKFIPLIIINEIFKNPIKIILFFLSLYIIAIIIYKFYDGISFLNYDLYLKNGVQIFISFLIAIIFFLFLNSYKNYYLPYFFKSNILFCFIFSLILFIFGLYILSKNFDK